MGTDVCYISLTAALIASAMGACAPSAQTPEPTQEEEQWTRIGDDRQMLLVPPQQEVESDTSEEGFGDPPEVPDTVDPKCYPPTPSPEYTNEGFNLSKCDYVTTENPYDWRGRVYIQDLHMSIYSDYIDNPNTIQGRRLITVFSGWVNSEANQVLWPGDFALLPLNTYGNPLFVRAYDCPENRSSSCTLYQSKSGRVFYSHGGLCADTYPTYHKIMRGFVEMVVMQEITLDPETLETAFVEGGKTWCIPRVDFTYELEVWPSLSGD
ncbi:MAG: hypothetical protein AAFV53_15750 [Myxococcota bacterium]